MKQVNENENGSNDEWLHRLLATTGLDPDELSDDGKNAVLATLVGFLEDNGPEVKERILALANEGAQEAE